MYCTWKNTRCRKSKTMILTLKNRLNDRSYVRNLADHLRQDCPKQKKSQVKYVVLVTRGQGLFFYTHASHASHSR